LPVRYAGVLWATRKAYEDSPKLRDEITGLLNETHELFGLRSRLAAPIVGRYLYKKLMDEQQRLSAGWTYEPPTFYECNRPDPADESAPALAPAITTSCAAG
jgi:hypothetical protein